MPTEPLVEMVDREFAMEAARPAIEIAGPLLTELVNHASNASRRCMDAADERENVHLAPFVLYRHIIEQVDGIEVLLSHSCAMASKPLLRVVFESFLQLKYILDTNPSEFSKRSLAWLCHYYKQELKSLNRYDQRTQAGKEFQDASQNQFGVVSFDLPIEVLSERKEHLEAIVSSPPLREINEELEKPPRKKAWYAAYGGPSDLKMLAKKVGQLAEYETRYRPLCQIIHGTDASLYRISLRDGSASLRLVRDPSELPQTALFAAFSMLDATREILSFYRPGERLGPWYQREARPMIQELRRVCVGIRYEFKEPK